MTLMNPLLIQIVARLTPSLCGVSDYAILLAQELERCYGIGSAFVVLNSGERCGLSYPIAYSSSSQLLEACTSLAMDRQTAILLQCSGYGFSRDGAPLFLAEALRRVRKSGQFRIGAYFHELYASGMVWRSVFWHSHRQKEAVRRIAAESDLIATNLGRHYDWLMREVNQRPSAPIQWLPVSSNVGECQKIPPISGRRSAMVVFGLPATRRTAYDQLSSLGKMLNGLGIEEILDAGPAFDVPPRVSGIPVKRMGVLPAADITTELRGLKFGYVPHPPHALAKSGVFAGLCAHGAIAVLGRSFAGEVDELIDGVHLVSPRTANAAIAGGLDNCSRAAWHWYAQHRLHVHAEIYARWLFPSLIDGGAGTLEAGTAAEKSVIAESGSGREG